MDVYEIRQLIPVSDYEAVYSHTHGDGEPKTFTRNRIEFIGVAMTKVLDDGIWRNDWRAIVGIELCDGSFHICNEADNFEGFVRCGEELSCEHKRID